MPYMSLRARQKDSQKHPGRPDQPCTKRSTQEVQAEKAEKAAVQAQKKASRAQNIQDVAKVESQMEVQLQEKLASAHHPPPTQKKKVAHSHTKAPGLAAAAAAKDDDAINLEESGVAICEDVSSDSGGKYDPNKEDKATQLEEDKSKEEEQPKKKKLKKAGRGQLRVAIQSAQGKDLPGEWKAKRKASDREELPTACVHQSKKAKKSHSGIHNDWVQRTQDVVPHEDDFGKLGEVQVQTSVQLEVPRDELTVDNTHVHSHSPSSGKSFSSSSRPQSLPGSGDESEGGIADDAGERLSTERKQLSSKPLHPNVLKSHYSRSRSTTVDTIARIVPTTSVPAFIKPSTSAQLAQMWLKKGNIRLSDLPSHLQTHFIHQVTPHVYELFGINSAWEQPKLADLQDIWRDVFHEEHNLSSQTIEGIVALKLIDDRLSQWRKRFGEHALEALEEITFNDLPVNDNEHREWWCSWALTRGNNHCRPFYYTVYNDPKGSPPTIKGMFQSPLIAAILGTHMAWLSAIDEDVRSVKKLVGALIHSVQAAKRAIMWWETGAMIKPQKPLNEYSKANWGDCIETWEGRTNRINMTSDLAAVIVQLKEKQWDKILKAARASGKIKKRMMQMTVSETPEPSEVPLVELRDDNSDLMDED
ncbi:hypothetical protein V8E53_005857 [Lactarius tabidus]